MPNRLFRWGNFVAPPPVGVTFKKVVSGINSFYAIDSNNKLWSIGCNANGVLGDGTTTNRSCWVAVCCNYCYQKVAAHSSHVLGIKMDGCAVAWGNGSFGALGNGDGSSSCQPVAVCCNYTYCDIAAGQTSGAGVSLGVKTDGCAVGWGLNNSGQLGDGSTTSRNSPVAVCCNYAYSKISTNGKNSFGIKTNGCAVSWGDGGQGALGDGATTSRCQPVAICCNYAYCCIVSGDYVFVTVLGLKTDGCAVGWGYSGWGSIGTNTSDVCQPAPVCCNYTYCDIALKIANSSAIKTDGKAVTWGNGDAGALGNGAATGSSQPVAVCCNYDYCSIASGSNNVMAVKTDGTAVAWGCNNICQLGDRTTTSRCQPVAVCGFPV